MLRSIVFAASVMGLLLAARPSFAIPKNIKAVLPEPSHAAATTGSQSARTYWAQGGRRLHAGWHGRWRRFRH